MSMPPRLGAVAARALPGLTALALIWGAGCSRPPTLLAPHRYVRLDALMPLHPAWSQIQSLDREIDLLKGAPARSGPISYQAFPGLPAFKPKLATPANVAAERATQIEQDSKRYIDSLGRSLSDLDQSLLSVERRREQRRVEADVAARIDALRKTLLAENDVRRFAIQHELQSLILRDIVVKSRIQDLAQAHTRDTRPLREAQAEHEQILADIARLNAANAQLSGQNAASEAARKRDQFLREEQQKSRDVLAKREEELKADRQEKLAAAMRQQRETSVPPPAAHELPPEDPHAVPLPLPPPETVTVQPASLVTPAVVRQQALWTAQRERLLGEIRADTWKAVQQTALRQGWVLVDSPRLGASDGTAEAADAIRDQWRIGKLP